MAYTETEENMDDQTQKSTRADGSKLPQKRRRTHITMTVHPDTDTKLDSLVEKFRLPKGQIVDKLVMALVRCYGQGGVPGRLHCVTGEPCRMERRDVPEVL
jgi:hypothetical protein